MGQDKNTQGKTKKHVENKQKSNRIIRFRTLMASGVGFIPIPILDMAGILSIQLWMIRDIAKVYNVPFKKNIARSIIGTLVGNVGAVGLVKLIPGINILGSGAVAMSAGAATYALGKIFTQHFDQGGTLLSFDPEKSRAYFEELYEESKLSVQDLKAQEDSFKEADTQALASVATLKKANSELMATINNLEKQLKENKRERALAVAVAKTQTKAKQIFSTPKDNKDKRTWLGLLWKIVLAIVLIALLAFALVHFNIINIGDDKPKVDKIESVSEKNNTDNNRDENTDKSSIFPTDNSDLAITLIDSTTTPTDSLPSTPTDTTTQQQVPQDNTVTDSIPSDNGTSSVAPQDTIGDD